MHPNSDRQKELLEIASTFGTPTYVTDGRIIRQRIQQLRGALQPRLAKLLYALKANSLPEIVELIRDCGLGVDAVSPGEALMARRLGIPAEDIFYSANNMTDVEMSLVAEMGVTINVGEISRLRAFGRMYAGSSVSIRVNTQYGAGHHDHVVTAGSESKFGIPIERMSEVEEVCEKHGLRVTGLHQHIGSGNLDVEPYRRSVSILLKCAASFPTALFVNVGGGLGVPYRPEEKELDIVQLSEAIESELTTFEQLTGRKLALWMEPGRYLVAQSGVLLIKVNTLKESHGHVYAGTDSGMNHLIRPALYGAHHTVSNLSNPAGVPQPYHVVGNVCESSDFFARERDVPEIREGDVIAILDAGAYGSSMTSLYNLRPLPAEVFIDAAGKTGLVRRRESPEELVDRILASRVKPS